jgi:hypothetical protein
LGIDKEGATLSTRTVMHDLRRWMVEYGRLQGPAIR